MYPPLRKNGPHLKNMGSTTDKNVEAFSKTTVAKEKDRTSVEFLVKTTKLAKFQFKTTNSLTKFTRPY